MWMDFRGQRTRKCGQIFLIHKMNSLFHTLIVLALFLGRVFAQDNFIEQTEKWHLDRAAYAQFTVVPTNETKAIMHKGASWEPYDWQGPDSSYQSFQIRVGYSKAKQKAPKQFDFVFAAVTLHGFSEHSSESHRVGGVTLFEGPSTAEDIKVRLFPLQGTPVLNSKYKVATLFSEKAKLSWDVYVRFSDTKPDYPKSKE